MLYTYINRKVPYKPRDLLLFLAGMFALSLYYLLQDSSSGTKNITLENLGREGMVFNPIFLGGGILIVMLAFIMANRSKDNGFNGQYT